MSIIFGLPVQNTQNYPSNTAETLICYAVCYVTGCLLNVIFLITLLRFCRIFQLDISVILTPNSAILTPPSGFKSKNRYELTLFPFSS
jgi:hypothetical protein